MWELLQQRLMKSRSSWRGELYSGVTMGIWICTGFPFIKVIMWYVSFLYCRNESSHNLSLEIFEVVEIFEEQGALDDLGWKKDIRVSYQ